MENGHNNEFKNVSVIHTKCLNYLLMQLRNKETDSKSQNPLFLSHFCLKMADFLF